MKVLAICGSPRKGNTEVMLNAVLDSAKEKGAEAELVLLRKLKIEHCTGCDICWNEGKPCFIKDDFKKVLEKMLGADAIVLGSPSYFKNVSSLVKTFMDRTNEIIKTAKLKGKKSAFVCVGGQDLNNTMQCAQNIENFIEDHEMELIGKVMAKAEGPGEISKVPAIIDECKKLGEEIANS